MLSNRNPADDGRRCCLCGSDAFSHLCWWPVDHPRNSASIPLSVWECCCGLAFLHPIPLADQLPQDGDWWSTQRRMIVRRRRLKQIRTALQNRIWGDKKQRFLRQTRKAMPHGRLLDIGCGTGKMLDVAATWFDCEGVEPSPTAAKQCRQKGYKVECGSFEQIDIAPDSFDVAILDAVLEHVHDPVQVLRKVNSVLRPGGVVAIKVPKLRGPAHRIHGREWNGFRVGYHTFFFTGTTLSRALSFTGFDVLSLPKRDRPFDDILALWGRKRADVSPQLLRRAA